MDTSYTVLELKSMAKKRGLKGYSTMRKADLCILLGINSAANIPYGHAEQKSMDGGLVNTPTINVKSSKKLNTPHNKAPVSILKKRPTEALTPVTLHIIPLSKLKNTKRIENMETEIMIYIRPCDRNKLVFPCTVKSGIFFDQHEYDEYQKIKMFPALQETFVTFCSKTELVKHGNTEYCDRDEYARLANMELEKEKKELRAKKRSPKKVKFNV